MSSEIAANGRPLERPLLAGPPWAISVAVAIVFFFAARLSLALLDKSDGIALFWPAAGVATGFLVAFGPAVRLPVVTGVVAATLAANLMGDRNLASSTFFAVANSCGPVIVGG
jgi:integral membrane sensor domain MASE1